MAFTDEPCAGRGPALTHVGIPTCWSCGIPTENRPVIAAGDSADVPLEPAARRESWACSCWTCRHPSDANAEIRAQHHARHEDFQAYLAEQSLERWRLPTPERIEELARQEQNALPFIAGAW